MISKKIQFFSCSGRCFSREIQYPISFNQSQNTECNVVCIQLFVYEVQRAKMAMKNGRIEFVRSVDEL